MDVWIAPGSALGRQRRPGHVCPAREGGKPLPKGDWGCGKWGKRASKPLDAPKGLVGFLDFRFFDVPDFLVFCSWMFLVFQAEPLRKSSRQPCGSLRYRLQLQGPTIHRFRRTFAFFLFYYYSTSMKIQLFFLRIGPETMPNR